MNYIELIEKINNELSTNGVKSLYTLIANNIDIEVITSLMMKKTNEYNNLTNAEQKALIKYLKNLKLESQLLKTF